MKHEQRINYIGNYNVNHANNNGTEQKMGFVDLDTSQIITNNNMGAAFLKIENSGMHEKTRNCWQIV